MPEDYFVDAHKEGDNKNPIYFWEKLALKPEREEKDSMKFYEIEDDHNIREVIRHLESKLIGQKLSFKDVHPKNSSVKKWINAIDTAYPEINESAVEDILNTFRDNLYARSKESHKIIVGLLLMKDVILLVHSKKDPSLAEVRDKLHSATLVLHPKNVLRASLIKNEGGVTKFAAFEHSRHWSKGHAGFWGIEPEYVTWSALGNIVLTIEMEHFNYPIQLPIESDELDEMVKDNRVTPSGKINLGRLDGKIIQVDVFKKSMGFPEFYDYYVTEKENLKEHQQRFKKIVFPTILQTYDNNSDGKYLYEDDLDKVLQITVDGNTVICNKKHPRFTICYFAKHHPRIKPTNKLIQKLYQAIFDNTNLDIFHAGEKISQTPITIGNLNVYNYENVNPDMYSISNNFLSNIQDSISKKERTIMQYHFCEFWKKNLNSTYIKNLFDYIQDEIIVPDLEFEFNNDGICATEGHLEFKSSSQWTQPASFVKKILVPTLNKYSNGDVLTRLCILYGIEDNGEVKPLYHIKSDQITYIEETTNNLLKDKNFKVAVQPIPFKGEVILSVHVIPIITS
jgi:hypothetical protein